MLKMIDETISELLENTTQEKIINLIKTNKYITQEEIASKLGTTRDGISYNIKKIKEKGIIKRVGSTKKGY